MIAEPVTLATDYALAGACGAFGFLLYRRRNSESSRAWWAAAFAALALTALLGGTYHGFPHAVANFISSWLWKLTLLLAGVASFCMLTGSAIATTVGTFRTTLFGLAGVKLLVYEAWMLGHDEFTYVIADTGAAMVAVAALHACSALVRRDPASRWILGGVALSAIAAGVQASSFDPHRDLNHNDLYHLIQIGAMLLFYRGAKLLRGRIK